MATRILIAAMAFDNEQGGGSTHIAYDLAVRLARRGYEVIVICQDLFGNNLERELIGDISVLRYRLKKPGGLNIRRHKEHLRAIKRLLTKYVTDPPDVVHGHNPLQYIAALDLFQYQSRCYYSIHSPAIEELYITWGRQGFKGRLKLLLGIPIIWKLERSIMSRSTGLTALSNYTINLIARDYGKAVGQKIQMIPGWVDLGRYKPLPHNRVEEVRRHLGWPSDSPLFFILRRLEPRMGLDNLLRAIVLVRRRGYNLYAAIGGAGSLRTHLEKLRNKLGLEKIVTFMGFVAASELPLAYGACDASVIPTSQLECFGLIALEALACGRTTLVTPVGALPEVMQHFEPEWIAKSSTPEGIADIMIAFLQRRLPVHSAYELHNQVKREYSAEQAVNAYERLMFQP